MMNPRPCNKTATIAGVCPEAGIVNKMSALDYVVLMETLITQHSMEITINSLVSTHLLLCDPQKLHRIISKFLWRMLVVEVWEVLALSELFSR